MEGRMVGQERRPFTFRAHTPNHSIPLSRWMHARPRSNVHIFPPRHTTTLDQRQSMFPATQRAHTSHALYVHYVPQALAPAVAKDRALHVRGFELPPLHKYLALRGDAALSYVQAVVVVFAESEDHGDAGCAGGGADGRHVRGGVGEGVFDVGCCEGWV